MRILLALLGALACVSVSRADDGKGWADLTGGKDWSAWKGNVTGWERADSVELDGKNPKLLSYKEGSAFIVNGVKGRAPNLVTKESFGDVELHAEFLIPKGSNSGVKFHAHYEIQIHDSFGVKQPSGEHCGGVYPRAENKPKYHHIDKGVPPRVNACKEPGQWQTLDVIFLAPRFDKDGTKTANARIVRATLNGQVIHENVELKTPTGANYVRKEMATGPLLLQGDHGPVAFRNVRIRPYQAK